MVYLSAEAYDDANHKLAGNQIEWYVGRKLVGRPDLWLTCEDSSPVLALILVVAHDDQGRTSRASVSVQITPRPDPDFQSRCRKSV